GPSWSGDAGAAQAQARRCGTCRRAAAGRPAPSRPPHGKRPALLLVPRGIAAVALLRIAIDERTGVEGVAHAAHFVLDAEQHLALGIDDVLETVLMLIALLRDQPSLQQFAVGAGKIRQINRHVVPVEIRGLNVALAEDEALAGAYGNARVGAALVV